MKTTRRFPIRSTGFPTFDEKIYVKGNFFALNKFLFKEPYKKAFLREFKKHLGRPCEEETSSGLDIKDVMEIANHGVFVTSTVVVEREVKSVGKVPSKEDIKKWTSG